jgi:hypothetical protein
VQLAVVLHKECSLLLKPSCQLLHLRFQLLQLHMPCQRCQVGL